MHHISLKEKDIAYCKTTGIWQLLNLIPRAHFPFRQHQEHGLWQEPIFSLRFTDFRCHYASSGNEIKIADRTVIRVVRFHNAIDYGLETLQNTNVLIKEKQYACSFKSCGYWQQRCIGCLINSLKHLRATGNCFNYNI